MHATHPVRSPLKSLFSAALMATLLASPPSSLAADPPGKALSERAGIPWPAVIAHRGASFDAPEETLPAFVLARELGADYLELDLQRSQDGVLIALHDDNLRRTTNIAEVFPDRADQPASQFTLAELKRLDAGSWFNRAWPERARPGYRGLKILTLDEVIDIAEGGANKPGLYIETKVPALFPGIEADLKAALARRGWLAERPAAAAGHVDVARLPGRVVLQTFDKSSLQLLHRQMPQVPKVLLLWIGKDAIRPLEDVPFKDSGFKDRAAWYASLQVSSRDEFNAWIDWARDNGAIGTGPAARLAQGGSQSYMDLVKPWMNQQTHAQGLIVHPYTVDDVVDFKAIGEAGVDGFFTNRPAELLRFYQRPPTESIEAILRRNGY